MRHSAIFWLLFISDLNTWEEAKEGLVTDRETKNVGNNRLGF